MLMAHLSRVMGPIVSAMITLHALEVPMALRRVYCINCNLAGSGRCETSFVCYAYRVWVFSGGACVFSFRSDGGGKWWLWCA